MPAPNSCTDRGTRGTPAGVTTLGTEPRLTGTSQQVADRGSITGPRVVTLLSCTSPCSCLISGGLRDLRAARICHPSVALLPSG